MMKFSEMSIEARNQEIEIASPKEDLIQGDCVHPIVGDEYWLTSEVGELVTAERCARVRVEAVHGQGEPYECIVVSYPDTDAVGAPRGCALMIAMSTFLESERSQYFDLLDDSGRRVVPTKQALSS